MKISLLIMAILGLIAVNADVVVEDVEEKNERLGQKKQKSGTKKNKLTPEQIAEKRQKKQQRTQKLESCLVITRSYYAQHTKAFTTYIDNHPSCVSSGSDQKAMKEQQNRKNFLLSKINANMLIQCDNKIRPNQIDELQKFKKDATLFDSNQPKYSKLVQQKFSDYNVVPAKDGKNEKIPKVQFTQEESQILSAIEDINDKFNKAYGKPQNKNTVNIAFFDVQNMSGPMQIIYLLGAMGGIAGLVYLFYVQLVVKKEIEENLRREKHENRKSKKKNK